MVFKKTISMEERFHNCYIPEPSSGCWLWEKFVAPCGYGRFSPNRATSIGAHRVSYKLFKGEIPEGLLVCHRCDIKICVNPDHLFLGTHKDNCDDMNRKGRHPHSKKTHCKNGHALTDDNRFITKRLAKNGKLYIGKYRCRECARLNNIDWYARRGREIKKRNYLRSKNNDQTKSYKP